MTTKPMSPKFALARHRTTMQLMALIDPKLAKAVDMLADSQPGYPSAGDGMSSGGGHSDPTATLALAPDQARTDQDRLNMLVARIARDVKELDNVVRCWQPPGAKWREVLETDAASRLNDDGSWCETHRRANNLERTRRDGGRQCRWCEDVTRDLGFDPPLWLVEKRIQGRKITNQDLARAKREHKTKRKGKR